jgi:GNAT superfamily N-acetyltransferase
MQLRLLDREEVPLIWTIDRSETHDEIYVLRDGALKRTADHFEIPGWHPAMIATDTPRLRDADLRIGAFDGDTLVGVAVLEGDRLFYLYVDAGHRGRGVGTALFDAAGADKERLVISSIPTRNSVDFYLGRGCVLDPEPDPAQVAAEPDDVQLVWTRP